MAPAVQSTYDTSFRIGLAGLISNSEVENTISRTLEGAALPFGQPVLQGTQDHTCILASQETLEVVAAAALGSNTGNGVMGAVTVTAGAMIGNYVVTVIEPGANAGIFNVIDPYGREIGHGVVGSAFSAGGLAFTLADGATDFVSGDAFTLPVTPTAGTDVGELLGLSVRDQTVLHTTADQYEAPDNVAIMTMGQMWVTAGATLVPGDPVFWNPSTKRFTKTTTHLRIPTARYDSSAVNGGVILVSLRLRPVVTPTA